MIPLEVHEVSALTGGTVLGDPASLVISGQVRIDSRLIGPGDLFVAVPGTRVDGHEHVADAFAAGAVAALVHRADSAAGGSSSGGVRILVPDTTAALADLARAVHGRLRDGGLRTVAVTGSAGKTTTKDLLRVLLADRRVVAAQGSFNNELGLPLSVLQATSQDEVLVLEMGARGRGHIAHLCGIARPDVAVVLGVGSAHLGEFGSKAATAAAKGEIVEALAGGDPTAVAVLNADDPLVVSMASRTAARVVTFGESLAAAVRAVDVDLDEDARLGFTLSTQAPFEPGTGLVSTALVNTALVSTALVSTALVNTALVGEQHLPNVLAAATVALELGVGLARTAELLNGAAAASPHRMQVTDRADGVRIVDDAYNANPESVAAALRVLAQMGRGRERVGGRTWAVLGEMLELGPESREAHDRLGRLAVRLDIDRLVVVGAGALPLHAAARHEGSWGEESVHVPDIAAARSILLAELAAGDVVLLKASNSIGLWRLAGELAAAASPMAGGAR